MFLNELEASVVVCPPAIEFCGVLLQIDLELLRGKAPGAVLPVDEPGFLKGFGVGLQIIASDMELPDLMGPSASPGSGNFKGLDRFRERGVLIVSHLVPVLLHHPPMFVNCLAAWAAALVVALALVQIVVRSHACLSPCPASCSVVAKVAACDR